MASTTALPTAADLRVHLDLLMAERALVGLEGFDNATYAADLADEIVAMRGAYVGAAVTEIASLRAELSGALVG